MSNRPPGTGAVSWTGTPWNILDLPHRWTPTDTPSNYAYTWVPWRYWNADYSNVEKPRDMKTMAALRHRIEEPYSAKSVLRRTLYHLAGTGMRNGTEYHA